MGCDIHIYTEKLKTVNDKKQWINCDYWIKNSYYDPIEEDPWETEYAVHEFYQERDYELFAALAGVRTNGGPVVPLKGFPDNASEPIRELYKRWDSDGHSHSYLTITELKQLQKNLGDTVKRKGMLTPEQYEQLQKGIKPTSWCSWTSFSGYIEAEWEDDFNSLNSMMEKLNKFIESRFYNYEIEDMSDDDFRIVFWFDN